MIKLPQKGTDEGAEARLLLAECRGPSFSGYSLADAKNCMELMDLVLWNRVRNPGPFLAKSAKLLAVIKAKGQFKGFENYPHYDALIARNIQDMIDIANNPKDQRSSDFTDFIQTAIDIANAPTTVADPSAAPQKLSAWRTAGAGSPGSNFTSVTTVLGTTFFST